MATMMRNSLLFATHLSATSAKKDDIGASFAVTIEGAPVIDIWAGHRDAAKTLDWEEDHAGGCCNDGSMNPWGW